MREGGDLSRSKIPETTSLELDDPFIYKLFYALARKKSSILPPLYLKNVDTGAFRLGPRRQGHDQDQASGTA
jgi:hypothetical protein